MTEYRLVPVEPTEEMIEAVDALIQKTHKEDIHFPDGVRLVWATMLAAAPPAPSREVVAWALGRIDGATWTDTYVQFTTPKHNGPPEKYYRMADAILSLLGMRAKEGEG